MVRDKVELSDEAYARLLALRTGLRLFDRWSAERAKQAGLTPAQHQLLLAIRGHGDPRGPTIGEVADYLLLQHHSTVGLADRAEGAGLVLRTSDETDRRIVRLQLTPAGAERLEKLTALHVQELDRLALELPAAWEGLAAGRRRHGFAGPPSDADDFHQLVTNVEIGRIYDEPKGDGARRVLVDRLWPRGIAKDSAQFDDWLGRVAPSSELRRWYGHDPARQDEFSRRYRIELGHGPANEALRELRAYAKVGQVRLVTATRDLERSAAAVLLDVLAGR
ncbi:MAG: DUF488 family protein, N3 subclade [Acidimicrobiales bacterium]